jgi:hypothetical protein
MINETFACSWCGADGYYSGELVELYEGLKCEECIIEDCLHSSTWIDYISSNSHRARFNEHCSDCKSWRIYKFYFHKKTARFVGPWRHDDVDES